MPVKTSLSVLGILWWARFHDQACAVVTPLGNWRSNVTYRVPFGDLYAQYLNIKPEIDSVIAEVIASSAFVRGPFVERFEQQFAEIIGRRHCVSCANGTDSLYIAMHALGVRPGDEVIVPALTWISTAQTVTQLGATVVFCDIDSDSYTIDPAAISAKITPRTVGIIPVHLYGQPADMDAIMSIASRNKLWILEDCAQAHLAKYRGQLVGTFGNAASFSFYPGKNLGAMGDAGAIVTNDDSLAERMAMFARHGGLRKGEHIIEGINSRLDGLQAAVLSVKLRHLGDWTTARQRIAEVYTSKLSDLLNVATPEVAVGREPVWHLYVVRTDRRADLVRYLDGAGVQTSINYPVSLPFLPAYSRFAHRAEDFPRAYYNQSRILSLPIFPELTEDQIDFVTKTIIEWSHS
jgi:dTDP-4-amino-4,6-dideoxygalactose transaminase